MNAIDRTDQSGLRIRDRRLSLGLKQAELANAVGISAAYLNLIEHGHRRIGGKLLLDIARVLEVDPPQLTQDSAVNVASDVLKASQNLQAKLSLPAQPEHDRAEELTLRFPGWAALLVAQHQQLEELARQVDEARDKTEHCCIHTDNMLDLRAKIEALQGMIEGLPSDLVSTHAGLFESLSVVSEAAARVLGRGSS